MICWGCQLVPEEREKCRDRSMGRTDLHHLLSQQTLRRELRGDSRLPDLLGDHRNMVPVGRYHHGCIEARVLNPVWDDLPNEAVVFASEVGLAHLLERRYPMKVRATK